VTSTGVTSLPLAGLVSGVVQRHIIINYALDEVAPVNNYYVELESIRVLNNGTEVAKFSGYSLSNFSFVVVQSGMENGSYNRKNAQIRYARFKYDIYTALFSDKQKYIGADVYQQILDANPGMAESIEYDPQVLNAWSFGEGYPIIKVNGY